MSKAAAYILSSYSFINTYSIDQLLDVGYQSKEGNPIPSFDENLLIELCSDAQSIFEKEANILEIDGDFIIVGDIHGSFHDLLRILNYIQKKNSKVLFLGDYVDRGNFSLECITLLFALKVMEPEKYFLLRGNHEFDSICRLYGFFDEIINYHNPKKVKESSSFRLNDKIMKSDSLHYLFEEKTTNSNLLDLSDDKYSEYFSSHKGMDCYKYSHELYFAFIKAFAYLPIASIINKTNFCIHGGLSPYLERIDQIRYDIARPINKFEESELFSDIVWSDPCSVSSGLFSENPRGSGCLFSKDALTNFLNENTLKRLIRAHEFVKNGSIYNVHEKCITVFSASSYGKEMENKSVILKLSEKNDKVKFVTFSPLHRLDKADTIYYKVQAFHPSHEKNHLCFSFKHPNLAHNAAVKMVKNKAVRHIMSIRSMKQLCSPSKASKMAADRNNVLIQRPILHSSVSMCDIKSRSAINEPSRKIKTLNSFDALPSLNDN